MRHNPPRRTRPSALPLYALLALLFLPLDFVHADPVDLCYSPSPGNLLSIDSAGLLVKVSAPALPTKSSQAPRPPRVHTRNLSPTEMAEISEGVRRIVKNYRESALSWGPSEVISISEVAYIPQPPRLQPGMSVYRFWVDGETWEFYVRSPSTGATNLTVDPDIRALDKMIQKMSVLSSPLPAERMSQVRLAVFERPKVFFVPDLHAEVMPQCKTLYIRAANAPAMEKKLAPLVQNFNRPGVWALWPVATTAQVASLEAMEPTDPSLQPEPDQGPSQSTLDGSTSKRVKLHSVLALQDN